MAYIEFVVPGKPVGKQRPKFARTGGFVRAYTPSKTVNYEKTVALFAHAAMTGMQVQIGKVNVGIDVTIAPPKSWSNRKKQDALVGGYSPLVKPDVDNVAKTICDAMNGVVYADDAQIIALTICKRYGVEDVVRVRVTFWHESP